jgi:hypothetical protein
LQNGSAVVEVDQTSQDYNVSVALKDGVVTLSKVGVYRFDSNPARVKVFHGCAMVQLNGQMLMVGTGKMLALSGTNATAEKFDVEQTDSLDNWSRRRAEAMALANISGAKYSNDTYGTPSSNTWSYNPYFDMYTYLPMSGRIYNPYYNLYYYSPMAAYQYFVVNPVYYAPTGGGVRGTTTTATPMSGTATSAASGISAARAGGAGVGASAAPAASAASSSAGAASSASSGHGSASSGGHGK